MKKKILAIILAAAIIFCMAACGDSSQEKESNSSSASSPAVSNAPKAASEPVDTPEKNLQGNTDSDKSGSEEYEITYSNVKTYTNSIGTTYAQVIVEIENTGTTDLYLSSGSYDLEDENGKLITSNSMVTTRPEVISPGEKAYMYEEDMLDEAVEGGLRVLPRPSVEKAKVDNIRYSVTDLEIAPDKFGGLKARGRVENTTSEDADGMVYVAIILKNAQGAPIGQVFTIITEDLPAGSKIGFEASGMSLPDDVTSDSVAETAAYAYPLQFQF